MAPKSLKVWFDPEGDFLEVLFDPSLPGYFRETADDRVMEKVDDEGNVLGFSIMNFSTVRSSSSPIQLALSHSRQP
jgi:uncharacterized protein YuzE